MATRLGNHDPFDFLNLEEMQTGTALKFKPWEEKPITAETIRQIPNNRLGPTQTFVRHLVESLGPILDLLPSTAAFWFQRTSELIVSAPPLIVIVSPFASPSSPAASKLSAVVSVWFAIYARISAARPVAISP